MYSAADDRRHRLEYNDDQQLPVPIDLCCHCNDDIMVEKRSL